MLLFVMQVKPTNEQNANYSRNLIGLIILSIIFFILIFQYISNSIISAMLYFCIKLIVILFIIGYGVGKYFPKVSWKVIILPTIPWIIFWLVVYAEAVSRSSNNSAFALIFGVIGLILYIFVFIGKSVGIWAAKGKKNHYVEFATLSLVIVFIFIPIVLDIVTTIVNKTRPNISIEIDTRPNINIDDVKKYAISYPRIVPFDLKIGTFSNYVR